MDIESAMHEQAAQHLKLKRDIDRDIDHVSAAMTELQAKVDNFPRLQAESAAAAIHSQLDMRLAAAAHERGAELRRWKVGAISGWVGVGLSLLGHVAVWFS